MTFGGFAVGYGLCGALLACVVAWGHVRRGTWRSFTPGEYVAGALTVIAGWPVCVVWLACRLPGEVRKHMQRGAR